MLSLKTAHELNWGELQYIENPMMAKSTIERNNGNSVNDEPIHNANNYNLPDAFTRSINPYSEIHHKLENGHVFLVNTSTINPLLKNLKISDKQTTQCTIMPGQTLMFKNSVNAMLCYVRVPQISGVVRQESKQQDKPIKEEKKKRERHAFLINPEAKDDRPLPEQYKVRLLVENETKQYLAVRQNLDVIFNGFSNTCNADQGDTFKIYAFNDYMKDIAEDFKKNRNIKESIASGLIKPLDFTTETRNDGVLLHQAKILVPGKTSFKMTRIKQTPHTTISELTVEHDSSKKWYVLEAGGPDSKVSGKGRIEKGTYQLAPYSSKNYPNEYQLKKVLGRKNIIIYEYDGNKSLTTGLAFGTSYDFTDDKKQHYKVDNSLDAKKEIYEMIGDGEAEIVITSKIKESAFLIGKRVKETDNTTLTELWEKDNPDKKWYVVEPAGPDTNDGENGFRVPVGGPYKLKMFSKQSGEYKNSIEVLGIKGRNKAIIAKAISYKKRDSSALFYIGNGYELDENLQIFELTESDVALGELVALLKSVKKSEITIENDTLIDNSGDSLKVSKGQFTFDVEGDDYYRGSPYFSRLPHVPGADKTSNKSGITIGRGTDLGQQELEQTDFESAGIDAEFSKWLAGAKGKQASGARSYLEAIPAGLKGQVITRKAQKKLFENLIEIYEKRAKSYFDGVKDSNNEIVKWSFIDEKIQEVLVDMAYRGDLKQEVVEKILNLVSENDKLKLAKFVGDPNKFKGYVSTLPDKNRCDNRREWLS
jgi:hypothetical protein